MNEEPDLADFINKKRVALPPLPTKTEQHSRLFEADLLGAWEKVCVYSLLVVVGGEGGLGFLLGSFFFFFFCILVLNLFL